MLGNLVSFAGSNPVETAQFSHLNQFYQISYGPKPPLDYCTHSKCYVECRVYLMKLRLGTSDLQTGIILSSLRKDICKSSGKDYFKCSGHFVCRMVPGS